MRMSFLQESVDDIPAVLAEVWEDKRDMHPTAPGLWILLPDELVERQMVLYILKPLAALLDVSVDAEVCRLAFQVLGVVHAANGFIEFLTAETAAYLDGFVHSHTKWFQNIGA